MRKCAVWRTVSGLTHERLALAEREKSAVVFQFV